MELVRLGINAEMAASLVEGTVLNEYNLLLGAGASIGARGGDGRSLPSAHKLAIEMVKDLPLDLPDPEEPKNGIGLREAYQEAKAEKPQRLIQYFNGRFIGCQPTWQAKLFQIIWERIWTLNIDDVLDKAAQQSSREVSFFTLSDRFPPKPHELAGQQVVHLHGKMASARSGLEGIVFDTLEYAKSAATQTGWAADFWSKYAQRPFVIIGAQLKDEIDLAPALDSGNSSLQSVGRPSVAVIKNVASHDKRRLERSGLIVIDCLGEEFINALLSDAEAYRRTRPEISAQRMSISSLAKFNQQFISLTYEEKIAKKSHDFYAGDEPVWNDILRGRDAPFAVMSDLFTTAQDSSPPSTVKICAVLGIPGSGKSTALLRLGRSAISRGRRVFQFRGEERPHESAVIDFVKATPACTLLFDDCADVIPEVANIAARAAEQEVDLEIAVTERAKRERGVRIDLASSGAKFIELNQLSRRDATAVEAIRRKNRRLGDKASSTPRQVVDWMLSAHKGDLFAASAALEGASGFTIRMDNELEEHSRDARLYDLVMLAAFTHSKGYPLPLRAASLCASMSPGEIGRIAAFDGPLGELLVIERRGLRLRHRVLAEHFVKRQTSTGILADIAKRIVIALAPLINIDAIVQRHYPFLIVRALLDEGSVRTTTKNIEESRQWYDDVQEYYKWNARFWDQRALLESGAGYHAPAYSYAKTSTSLDKHAFSYNTLGKVRFRAAIDRRTAENLETRWEWFVEGELALQSALEIAKSNGRANNEHPFETFFRYAVLMAKIVSGDQYKLALLNDMANRWKRDADSLGTKGVRIQEQTSVLYGSYIKAVLASQRTS